MSSDKVSTNVNPIISIPTYPAIRPTRVASTKFFKIGLTDPSRKCTTKKAIFTLVKNLNSIFISISTYEKRVRDLNESRGWHKER